jgi:hypothetical protein
MEAADNPRPTGPVRDAMTHLDDIILEANIPASHGLRPLAAFEDPAMIVTPYVEGEDLVSIMRRPEDPAWRWMADWMNRAGAMLAAYHLSSAPPGTSAIEEAKEDARDAARHVRARVGIVDQLARNVDIEFRCRPSYGDFGPGNLLGTPQGELYLLDPPVGPPYALVHRDLGNFVFELRRQLAGRGFTPHPPLHGRFPQLHSSFLTGYSEAGEPLNEQDLGLITLFESRRALGMARKRFPGRLGDVGWFARRALAGRRQAIRASRSRP